MFLYLFTKQNLTKPQRVRMREEYNEGMKGILTAEQWKKYEKMNSRQRRSRSRVDQFGIVKIQHKRDTWHRPAETKALLAPLFFRFAYLLTCSAPILVTFGVENKF